MPSNHIHLQQNCHRQYSPIPMAYCLTQALHSTPACDAKIFQTRGQLQLLLILNYTFISYGRSFTPSMTTSQTVVFVYTQ